MHKPKGRSRFAFHWKHHGIARRNGNKDLDYKLKLWQNETKLGVAAMILHAPLFLVFPTFTLTVLLYASIYLVLHRKSHEHVDLFKKIMPWHYEHHMGRNQNANWCVVVPFMDYVMGTREKWLEGE